MESNTLLAALLIGLAAQPSDLWLPEEKAEPRVLGGPNVACTPLADLIHADSFEEPTVRTPLGFGHPVHGPAMTTPHFGSPAGGLPVNDPPVGQNVECWVMTGTITVAKVVTSLFSDPGETSDDAIDPTTLQVLGTQSFDDLDTVTPSMPAAGLAIALPGTGEISWTPDDAVEPEVYVIFYELCDDVSENVQCGAADLTLVYNDPPSVSGSGGPVEQGASREVTSSSILSDPGTSQQVIQPGFDLLSLAVSDAADGSFASTSPSASLGGSCEVTAGGDLRYTAPGPAATGSDSCFIRLCESRPSAGMGDLSMGACGVGEIVFSVQRPFEAVNDTVFAAESQSADYAVADLLANDVETDGSFQLDGTSTLQGGSLVLVGDTLTYMPPVAFFGVDVFSYTTCRNFDDPVTGSPVCGGADVNVSVNGSPEQANAVVWVLVGSASVSHDPAGGFADVDGDLIDPPATLVDTAVGGTAVVLGSGLIQFTPTDSGSPAGPPGALPSHLVQYRTCDDGAPSACSDPATLSVIYNDAPTLPGDSLLVAPSGSVAIPFASITGSADTGLVDGGLDSTSLQVSADNMSFSMMVVTPLSGTCAVSAGTETITYTAPAITSGSDTCHVRLCESLPADTPRACGVGTYTFSITDAFAGIDDFLAAEESAPTTFTIAQLLANDISADSATFSLTNGTTSAGGIVADQGGGELVYTSPSSFFGTDLFLYEICWTNDPGICDTVTVFVNVNGKPLATDALIWVAQGQSTVSVDVTALFLDEADPMALDALAVLNLAGSGTALVPDMPYDGTLQFFPDDPAAIADYVITYQVGDDDQGIPPLDLLSDPGTITIRYNDPPVLNDLVGDSSPTLGTGQVLSFPWEAMPLLAGTGLAHGNGSDGDSDAIAESLTAVSDTSSDPFAIAAFSRSEPLGADGVCAVDDLNLTLTAPSTAGTYTCFIRICEELPVPTVQSIEPRVCAVAQIDVEVTE